MAIATVGPKAERGHARLEYYTPSKQARRVRPQQADSPPSTRGSERHDT